MGLRYTDRQDYYEKIALQGWKGGEIRTFKFLNSGRDYTGGEYGLTYIYDVEYEGEKWSLWVKPNSPMAFGLLALFKDAEYSLEGKTVNVEKVTGAKQSDTRYKCQVV